MAPIKHDFDLIAVANTVQDYLQTLTQLWARGKFGFKEATEYYVKSELLRRDVNCQTVYIFSSEIQVYRDDRRRIEHVFQGMIAVITEGEEAWSAKVSSETIGKLNVEWTLL